MSIADMLPGMGLRAPKAGWTQPTHIYQCDGIENKVWVRIYYYYTPRGRIVTITEELAIYYAIRGSVIEVIPC